MYWPNQGTFTMKEDTISNYTRTRHVNWATVSVVCKQIPTQVIQMV